MVETPISGARRGERWCRGVVTREVGAALGHKKKRTMSNDLETRGENEVMRLTNDFSLYMLVRVSRGGSSRPYARALARASGWPAQTNLLPNLIKISVIRV